MAGKAAPARQSEGAQHKVSFHVLGPGLEQSKYHQLPVRGQTYLNLPPGTGPVYVHVSVPGAGPDGTDASIGGGPLQFDGEFSIDAWADELPETLRLSFSDERGTFYVRDLPTEEALVPAGQVLEANVEEFSMLVFDGYQNPVEGAKLQLFAKHIGPTESWNTSLTDAEGRAGFLLPSGPIEYILSKPGLRFQHGLLDWDTKGDRLTEVLTLRRLRMQDMLSGRVVDSHGAPVSGALVTAGPKTKLSELSANASVSTRSDAGGYFSLQVAGNTSIELSAAHRDQGRSPALTLEGGEQHITVTFLPIVDGKASDMIPRGQDPGK